MPQSIDFFGLPMELLRTCRNRADLMYCQNPEKFLNQPDADMNIMLA